MGTIEISDHGRIRVIAIDRPEKRNAVDGPTAQALYDAFVAFDHDEECDVAILTGEGGAFCAGADLKAFAGGGEDSNKVAEGGTGTLAPMGVSRLQLSKPVIAAIEGHAVAGGMELALWCDLRVMARDAVMGIFCRRFGVPLIDMGTIRLPRLIGQSRAMDLILTGRPVDAEEAFAIGLANRLAAPGLALEEALELAGVIAAFPQSCMRNDRRSVLEQWGLDRDEAILNETRLGLATLDSGESRQGAARFTAGTGRHGKFATD
ncbi:MAG: crotonase/enoyl-CoA hydratase family protein [Salaquimonas sp.]|nr:crotonase/enoyl-CoA hydratase family protein [Salaquimonas sp.]